MRRKARSRAASNIERLYVTLRNSGTRQKEKEDWCCKGNVESKRLIDQEADLSSHHDGPIKCVDGEDVHSISMHGHGQQQGHVAW